MSDDAAIAVPERTRRAGFAARLERRAGGAPLALCVGIDPAPDALALLEASTTTRTGAGARAATAADIERYGGLLVESARDHAVAVKPQLAWYEAAGAAGIRALERTVAFARTAGLLVVLDGKRGDVPHTAAAYASAWLGDEASSGAGGDALTVNATVGRDSVEQMAAIAAERHCALYALLHTSNPGAASLQAARLEDGEPWWTLLARELAQVDEQVGGGVVGAVVGATRPDVLARARRLLPAAPLLVPGIGAQGAGPGSLSGLLAEGSAPTTLVVAARSLLPGARSGTQAFRFAVDRACEQLASALAGVGERGTVG